MEKLLDKEPIKRVRELIAKFDPALKILVLDRSARTAREAADSLKCEVGSIVKTLLLRVDHLFLICLVAGDKKCSINKLKKILKKKDICMANADEVKKYWFFNWWSCASSPHRKIKNFY